MENDKFEKLKAEYLETLNNSIEERKSEIKELVELKKYIIETYLSDEDRYDYSMYQESIVSIIKMQ